MAALPQATTITGVLTCGCLSSPCAVGNLSYDLTDQGMTDYFAQCGPVKTVRYGPQMAERRAGGHVLSLHTACLPVTPAGS